MLAYSIRGFGEKIWCILICKADCFRFISVQITELYRIYPLEQILLWLKFEFFPKKVGLN